MYNSNVQHLPVTYVDGSEGTKSKVNPAACLDIHPSPFSDKLGPDGEMEWDVREVNEMS